jgi:hypothetical protein
MKRQNLYQADVIVQDQLDEYLRKCFLNHLVIYNYSLDVLIKNPDIKFKDLKAKCYEYIEQKAIKEFMGSPLFNELYYQYKKFTERNIRSAKTLTGIHYITFLVNGYNNKCFSKDGKKLIIHVVEGCIELVEDLPEVPEEKQMMYFNLSYSNQESKYQLSVFQ